MIAVEFKGVATTARVPYGQLISAGHNVYAGESVYVDLKWLKALRHSIRRRLSLELLLKYGWRSVSEVAYMDSVPVLA